MNGVISLVHFCEAHGPSVMCCTQSGHKDQPNWSLINFSSYPCSTSQNSQSDLSRGGLNNYMGGLSYSSSVLGTSINQLHYSVPNSFSTSQGFYTPNRRQSNHSGSSNGLLKEQTLLGRSPGGSFDSNRRADGATPFSHCNACIPKFPPSSSGKPGEVNEEGGRGFVSQDPNDPGAVYTTTRYPNHPRLYAALRQACVRSLSCEFCPGHDGPVLFGDEKHGYTLSYMFTIRDVRARGAMRFYALTLLMTDRLHLIASATFIIGKFRALARFLQTRANPISRGESEYRVRPQSLQGRSYHSSTTLKEPPREIHRHLSDRSLNGDTLPPHMLTTDQFLRRRSSVQSTQLQPLELLLGLPHLMGLLHVSFALILSGGTRRLLESSPMPLQKWVEPTTVLMDVLPLHTHDLHSPPSSPGSSCTTPRLSLDHLGQLFVALGKEQFAKLVFNVAVGNQVIVQSSSRAIVQEVMVALQDIVPHSCFRKLEFEDTYRYSYDCNLLGLQREAAIPEHVDKTSLVLLEVDFLTSRDHTSNMLMKVKYGDSAPAYTSKFLGFVSQVLEVVSQYDYTHMGLSPADNFHALPSKSQLAPSLFGYSNHTLLSPKQTRLKLIALKESWSCKARLFASVVWPHADATSRLDPSAQCSRILQILKVDPIDYRVLRQFAPAFRTRLTPP
ncbi:hypothetical protein DSO57_1039039 [Entomophthora muscae]|uniref:Uncharacterized protein n=1 Tax=Entomophthora muscae TaxID=34485 RepID=A0ACC2SYH9_9FUNG|nr:hypothetical protein DSO57_1039039 [Entomophthora muscae]